MRRETMPMKKGKRVSVKVRLLPIFLAVVFLAAFLSPFFRPSAVWAEDAPAGGGTANQAPFLRTEAEAKAKPAAEAVLELGAPYTLDLADIFHDTDSPLTYYVREGSGSFKQTVALYTYQYTGTAREAVIVLSFKAGDGSLESPVYQVTLKYYADPSLAWLKYKVGTTGVTIIGCDQTATRINIPDYIEGKPVTAIAASAFAGCGKLAEIKLPSTLKTIGNSGFSGCTKLTGLNLPEGLTQVGERAFGSCTSLRDIYIPASLREFNPNVFSDCPNLHFTVASGNPKYTGQDGVIYSKDMTTLVAAGAIDGGSFTVPEIVTAISAGAFYNNKIQSITLGLNVKTIGENAFNGCTALKEVVLNEGLESIGGSAFAGDSALKGLKLPESLASMGQNAFQGSGLMKINLSQTAFTVLPYGTFADCAQLQDITLGDKITAIEDNAFRSCPFRTIDLPAKLRRLSGSFSSCTNLETLTLPYTLKELGSFVFTGCSNLKSVYFEGNMPKRGDGFGAAVPNTAWERENDSFSGLPLAVAENLKIYVLQGANGWGDSFTDYASGFGATSREKFEYKVTYYTLDELGQAAEPHLILHPPLSWAGLDIGAVSETMGVVMAGLPADAGPVVWSSSDESVAAVDEHGRVTAIKAGDSVITASLTYNGIVYTGEAEVNIAGPESVLDWSVLQDGTASINGFKPGIEVAQMRYLEIPETIGGYTVTTVRSFAFKENLALSSVKIPSTVKTIGDGAFWKCLSLGDVSLADGVREIGNSAFAATGIRDLVIPPSVTRIGDAAFMDCDRLVSADIKAGNLEYTLGTNLFRNNTSLKNVTLAEGVTKTGGFTFAGCTSLESIKLPSTLQALAMYDFSGCSNLRTVELQSYLLGQYPDISEKYNPFASLQVNSYRSIDNSSININYANSRDDLVILHPDDGNDWSSLFNNKVKTGIRTFSGGIRLDSLNVLPAYAGPVVAVNPGTAVAVTWYTVPDAASVGSEEPVGEEKTQSTDRKEAATVFEIVKKAVVENPLLIVLIGVIVLAILFLGGARRYKQYKKNQ